VGRHHTYGENIEPSFYTHPEYMKFNANCKKFRSTGSKGA